MPENDLRSALENAERRAAARAWDGAFSKADRRSFLGRVRDWDHVFIGRMAGLDQRGALRTWMLGATRVADGWGLFLIIPVALLWGARGFAVVMTGIVALVTLAIIVQSIKAIFRRARPSGLDIEDPIGAPDKHAFPSGHTSQAFGLTMLAFWLNPWLGLVILPVAVAVAFSRMFFGLHYPTDVLVGAVLGCVITLAVILVCEHGGLVNFFVQHSPLA